MKRLYYLIFFIFSILSCTRQESKEAMIIRDWLGRHIDLNENLTNALTGDTLIKDSHDYLLLTYIGKDGCTGCNNNFINLHGYRDLYMKIVIWKSTIQQSFIQL